jgi:hypothetical protein
MMISRGKPKRLEETLKRHLIVHEHYMISEQVEQTLCGKTPTYYRLSNGIIHSVTKESKNIGNCTTYISIPS